MKRHHPQVGSGLRKWSRFMGACLALFVSCLPLLLHAEESPGTFWQTDVFVSGQEGYRTYRIPAIVITCKGTLLAFCEGRKTSRADHGDIDLVLRRSLDGGRHWEPMQLVYEEGGNAKITIGNPCPVVDRQTGRIWLGFCRDNDRIFVTHSDDDGKTWAKPREITSQVKQPEWGWFATGPGHGLQLECGRLLLPSDCGITKQWGHWDKQGYSLVLYSDDQGSTWHASKLIGPGMNECEAVQLANGSVLLTMRQYRGPKCRAFATSDDGGITWTNPVLREDLYCPICQASIIRLTIATKHDRNRLLHCNPAGPGRQNLTVRLSYDEGQTWPVAKTIYPGSSAYSDLVVLPDLTIGCLFERDNYGKITFARFDLVWLTDGKDRIRTTINPSTDDQKQ